MIWKWYHIHLKEEPFYLPEKKKRKVKIGNGARGQYTCGLCGQKGHQSGTCSSVIQPRPPSPCDAYCTCEIRWNNANV